MAKKVKFIDYKDNEMMLDIVDGRIQLMIQSKMTELIVVFDLEKSEIHELVHELMRLKGGG
jgi:hypothetical protein